MNNIAQYPDTKANVILYLQQLIRIAEGQETAEQKIICDCDAKQYILDTLNKI